MTYKLVQITDTHLFEDPGAEQKGVNTSRTLRAVVDDVAARHPDCDALLLTGDLSQDETPGSYAQLERLLAPLEGIPRYAVPGNHDDPAAMRAVLGGGGRCHIGADACLGAWRIVMLDSRVPGAVHGELGAAQLARLRGIVAGGDRHVIVALHHPPLAVGCAWLDGSRCADGPALLAAAMQPPVHAVLCGHVHQQFETRHQGVSILTTPSTCVQFQPGMDEFSLDDAAPGYRALHLEDDGRWSTRVQRVEQP